MLSERHFTLLRRVNYNLRDYEHAADMAVDSWNDLAAQGWWPLDWTEEQMIEAWESDLNEACANEKDAIRYANAIRRDLIAMGITN